MRPNPITVRIAAAVGAAVLAVAVPAPPAGAQPAPVQPEPAGATPPPLDPAFPVPQGTDPDLAYVQKVQCTASTGGSELKQKPWGQLQLRLDELHRFATGEGTTVAVIDTGVNPHRFLGDRLIGGGDFVVGGEKGLRDCDGHGTEVAGIIAADPPPDSGFGFRGIAPRARILSIRQSSANYVGKRPTPNNPEGEEQPAGTLHTLAQAVVQAANAEVDVMNISINHCRPASQGAILEGERELQAALRYAVEQKNVVVVSSAGNTTQRECSDQRNGIDPQRPSNIVTPPWFSEHVLSVAAVNRQGDPTEFSVQGPWISVAAPGTEIISLDPAGPGLANMRIDENNQRDFIQGTSYAAPYVAGLAALVRQMYPQLDARQVMERIKMTALHPAAPGSRDNLVGYGVINPIGALTRMVPSEHNIKPDGALAVRMDMPPPVIKDWAPMQVALIGAGGGVLLLLLTLFIVHTVRRNRPELRAEARGNA